MNFTESKRMRELIAFTNQLMVEGLANEGDSVSVRLSSTEILITATPVKHRDITIENVSKVLISDDLSAHRFGDLHAKIYHARSDINAIITNHAPHCVGLSLTESKFPAVLDDVAQIIGPRVYVAPSSEIKSVLKCLKGHGACIVKNECVVATGRTVDEAHTAALVLEKGARAYIEGSVLGGAKKIPYFEAKLMRFVYKTKYSKADQEAKLQ
ncbi:MAG: class II aldolase/adducin family protein [Christensenellaceae bacterium]|nr:class II aldolase/adducin family protein [Christensenellaceae bacterium]